MRLVGILLFLTFCTAWVGAAQSTNVAWHKPVTGTGPTWPGYPASNLTDGNPDTFTHPQASANVRGYYFQVDLGRVFALERIVLRGRSDGCCAERLSRYRVEIYGDRGGETGPLNWGADFRSDGSYPTPPEADTITAAADAAGIFAGRFVRVVNVSDAAYNPQLGEIEVYGSGGPVIRSFAADPDVLRAGEATTLRWEVANATELRLEPGVGSVNATGSVSVRPSATTTYVLTAIGPGGAASTNRLTVGVDVTLGPPAIREFLADNNGGFTDEDDETPDWIELVNTNAFRLNLAGYYLTDDPADLRKWRLPAAAIPAGGTQIVFASGKNHSNPTRPLHTNFRLDAAGDYLALVDPDGERVRQQFPADYPTSRRFPPQRAGISFGLGTNGITGYLRPPTPGLPNGSAFAGIVGDTTFSADRGFYDTNVTVAITCKTPGAVIRYTTDRSDPTATTGTVYANPLTFTSTTVLRAAAFLEGWAPSDVDTQTYLFPSNIIAASSMRTSITRHAVYGPQMRAALMDLPSVSLATRATINDSSEVKVSFEWIRSDGQPGIQADCGVQQYGGAFTDFAKKSFRLYFRRQYGVAKLKYPIFEGHAHGLGPVDEFDQLELRNGSHDMEMRGFYMANVYTDDTLLEMGHLNPHGRFVHLYLNGAYWGVYHLRERWGAAMHASYLGGSGEDYESINGNWNVGGWAEPGTAYDGDGHVWQEIKRLRGSYRQVRSWLDVPEYVDYMLMWMFGGSEDEYRCVGPVTPGSGMKFYLNDADGWFCGPWYCAADNRTSRGAPGRQPGDGPGSVFSTLFAEGDPEYRLLLADHIRAALFDDGALTPARNLARLETRTREMERPFLAESARWNYLTPTAWAGRRDSVRTNWIPRRTAEVLGQWRATGFYPTLDAPTLNAPAGGVTNGFELRFLGPGAGTVYFTFDGTDPRLLGGAVSPTARAAGTGATTSTVIPLGSTWRWYTDATGLGSSAVVEGAAGWSATNWKHPSFDDGKWSSGPAQLGYGEQDEATVIPYGGDAARKWVTAYFRQRFELTAAQELLGATIRLRRDDGAIVYVNGREAYRSSMPDGLVLATTFANSASDDGQLVEATALPLSFLRSGANVIAVELHQSSFTTSDASFDLELTVSRPAPGSNARLTLDRNTLVKARARDGSTWSALTPSFVQVGPSAVGPGEVRVTELNFHPPGIERTEFIELANVSSRAVNLRGCRFDQGIQFAFSPYQDRALAAGERLVLVRDLQEFLARFGTTVPVAGVFQGNLANGGEPIRFVDAGGQVITQFHFDDTAPWPVDADGAGRTLVLQRLDLDPSDPRAWRTSVAPGGSPGTSDAVPFVGQPTEDADADGVPALLEYVLGTDDRDPSQPGRWQPIADESGHWSLALPRQLSADDAALTVEVSIDLVEWKPAFRKSLEVQSGGRAQEVWEITPELSDGGFVRVGAVRLGR